MPDKPPKKQYIKYPKDAIPERFKNKSLTPREREEERLFEEMKAMALVIREQNLAEVYGTSLKRFLKAAWPIMSPTPFQDGFHIGCICEHVEALLKRQIRRLIINIPPRSGKSQIISVAAPAWRWITHPEEQFLCASYSRALSLDFSRKTRNLIMSPWYQHRWRDKFALSNDQNEKGKFENDKGGARLAFSVEGGILGEGGSCAIYDDPNDLNEMSSPTYRQSVKDWYSGSASSRFINPQTDVRVCVQQRASYGDDLTSFLMELGGWEQVVIPMEYTGRKFVTSIGWEDPRTTIGELMHPKRFGPLEIQSLKVDQRQNWQGQYQQEPIGGAGDSLHREWWRFYNPPGVKRLNEKGEVIPVIVTLPDGKSVSITPIELPSAFEHTVTSLDCAFKNAEHNDYVAAHAWGRLGANTFLIGREHGHMSFTETKTMVQRFASLYPSPEKLVEDKANGTAIMDELKNIIPGLVPVEPYGSKWSRVAAISGYVEAGNVYLPNPDLYPWVWDLIKEFADGQSAKHDDDTDAMSQALKRLYDSMARTGVPEFRVQPRWGEPQTACHVEREFIPPLWRRFVAIMPGQAALWLAETPTGSIRVLRELSLEKLDAEKAGLQIGRLSLPDCLARMSQMRDVKRQVYELFFPRAAFAALESGSYAEMLEKSLLSFEPEAPDYDARGMAKEALKAAHFRSDMIEEEDASLDRLRALMAFQPPGFKAVPYDRKKAFALAEQNINQYADYMAATDGAVRGEWPRLKIDPDCKQLISELGSFRRDKIDQTPPFVQALLLGVCITRNTGTQITEPIERPWPVSKGGGMRNRNLFFRKFGTR